MKKNLIIFTLVSLLIISCKTDDPVTPGENSYKIHGTVYSDDGNTPVEQVKVIIGTDSTSTDSLGYYEIAGAERTEISIKFIHDDFIQKDTTIIIDTDINMDVYLTRIERYYSVSGYVLDAENTNRHIDSVLVSIGGSQIYSDSTGYFEFSDVLEGEVELKFEHYLYSTEDTVTANTGNSQLLIKMNNKISLEERLEALKYYPLNLGDYKEYKSIHLEGSSVIESSDTNYVSVEITKDTLMSNGKRIVSVKVNIQEKIIFSTWMLILQKKIGAYFHAKTKI